VIMPRPAEFSPTELLILTSIAAYLALDALIFWRWGHAATISEAIRTSPRWAAYAVLYGVLGWHLFGPK
jgi:hypothetical protein